MIEPVVIAAGIAVAAAAGGTILTLIFGFRFNTAFYQLGRQM
jgi:hypothetical protein